MSFTPNYGLQNMTPGDPQVLDAWGTIENTGRTLVDTALGGELAISVAGSANVIWTSTPGIPDQSRYAHYVLSGVLTGNIQVLWPQNFGRCFSVLNSTTGAFTLNIGANNGAGIAGGAVVPVPQGMVLNLYSDGTNVSLRDGKIIQYLSYTSSVPGVTSNLPANVYTNADNVTWTTQFPTACDFVSVIGAIVANGNYFSGNAYNLAATGATIQVYSGQAVVGIPLIVRAEGH